MKLLLYRLKRVWHFFKTGLFNALPAMIKYHFPQKDLTIIAITGTDGKTTSATMLYHVLKHAGLKVGLITTVAAYIKDKQIPTGFHVTSPQPKKLYQFLAQAKEKEIKYLVLEVTSHGHYQYRDFGLKFALAGLTNITQEHLDYHLNYEEYVKAKLGILKKAKKVVLNEADKSFWRLQPALRGKIVATYSPTSYLPKNVAEAVKKRFEENFNHTNARLVYELAKQLKIHNQTIAEAMLSFPGVPGRMEPIPNKRSLNVYVDFAHTPNGLEASLKSLKKLMRLNGHKNQKLIAVYGSAGERDVAKRPLMGKIGSELVDLAVFTAEDPRHENVYSIIRQMKSGIEDTHDKVLTIVDRRQAIYFAINKLAQKNDYVVILGKGHEASMNFGGKEIPWSDRQVALEALKKEF